MTNRDQTPFVSVILPVFNGAAILERAVRSVVAQTFTDWELLAVDDGSTDATLQALQGWAARDARIRVIHLKENGGLSAARNAALRQVRGEFVAYLDHDDEYHADYLAQVARLRDAGDVLVFGYDLIYDDGAPPGRPTTWDPAGVRSNLFAQNIVTPLGAIPGTAIPGTQYWY